MSQKYRIVIQPEAQQAIEEAYLWLSHYSQRNARLWIEGLYKAILSLERIPSRCSLALETDFFEQEIRQLIYGKGRNTYKILFTIVDNTVQVLLVRHASQKPLSNQIDEEE